MDSTNRMLHALTTLVLLSSCSTTSNALQTSFQFNPTTNLAAVRLSCVARDEVVEIVSVGYRYSSRVCKFNCTDLFGSISGNVNSIECRNERKITSACDERKSCTIADITRPNTKCSGGNPPSHIRVDYNCVPPDVFQTFPFNPSTNPATYLATVTLNCVASDEVMEIEAVEYNYEGRDCRHRCPLPSGSRNFFDGSRTECRNEEILRSACYARNSCTMANIRQPYAVCLGEGPPSHVKVNYRCISSDYVFNLCEKRSAVITEETSITFTTPLTPADGHTRSSCKCSLRSRFNNQAVSPGLSFTRVKMAEFRNDDQLRYKYLLNSQLRNLTVSQTYHSSYLMDERVDSLYNLNRNNITIILNRPQPQETNSKAFITVQPGKDIIVECNGAVLPTQPPTETSEIKATSNLATGTDSTTTGTDSTTTGTDSTTTGSSGAIQGSNTTLPSTMESPNALVIGLVVSLVVVSIICVIIIFFFCRKSRSWRRKRRAEQLANGRSNNNNATMKLLNSPVQEKPADTVYHELEKQEDPYDVISVDEEDNSHTAGAASPPSSADPYKVSNLPDLSVELNASRLKPVDQFRNSRGSIDVYTENSTITDNVYSEPCDVDQAEGSSPRSRKYDEPANVTYAEVRKPAKTTGVELIDNELYGT